MSGITYRGLNVSDPEVTTREELETFFNFADQPMGRPIPSYELWAELRPDVLKRCLNFVHHIHKSETFSCPLPYLNIYTVGGWNAGVRYCFQICEPSTFISGPGYSKDAVIETLAVSFFLAPSWGSVEVAQTIRECLADYKEPEPTSPSPFPDGWTVDPDALKAGLDYSTPDMTKKDLANLKDWYLRVCGELPRSLETYAKYRPSLLKASRNRWENIVRTGLPNQMFAYLFLHHEVWRGNVEGMREAALLAKGLGMSKEHAVDAICYGGVWYGGTAPMALADRAIGDILDSW